MLNHWIDTLNGWLHRWRYLKFGLVGASGTVVNLLVLWLGQEFVFQGIEDSNERLYSSLALAIAVATLNNFAWNRIWTWNDRTDEWHASLIKQFARYAMASWLGTCVQYILTLALAQYVHYLAGNIAAIVVASVINYFANDWWTFKGQSRVITESEQGHRLEKIALGLFILAAFMYVLDLGGENIPRNGDELVYAHIAFKTWLHAQSTGQWLPLLSDIDNMRNTKPPLLIWQAMSVSWLHLPWSLWWLRLPSVVYTLITAWLCVWSTLALAQDGLA
jgi:dolichol-phosphate mannosyltransferase